MWTLYQPNNIDGRLSAHVFDDDKARAGMPNVTAGPQQQYFSKVDCYPLLTLLLAANMTKIDFMRLDVEGFEIKILQKIPWDRMKIRVIACRRTPHVHAVFSLIYLDLMLCNFTGDFP
jgi:FkbM family methyltransferase